MKAREISAKVLRKMGSLAVAAWLTQSAFAGAALEQTFDVLQTRTGTYTNVTVSSKEQTYIFIVHANGISSVKVQDLTLEDQQKLGYATMPTAEVNTNDVAMATAEGIGDISAGSSWIARLSPKERATVGLAIICFFYLFMCFCCHRICMKAELPNPLVWVPGLQAIPLFNVAGMSGLWTLGLLVPLMNIAIYIKWSVTISNVDGIGKWRWFTLLLLLLPLPALMLSSLAYFIAYELFLLLLPLPALFLTLGLIYMAFTGTPTMGPTKLTPIIIDPAPPLPEPTHN